MLHSPSLTSDSNRNTPKSLIDQVQVSLHRPYLWERCRDLTKAMTGTAYASASVKELRTVFASLCGDIFGYPAGGTGMGWNISGTILKSASSNKDFYASFSFLSANGPMMDLVDRLTTHLSGQGHSGELFEYPTTQLPAFRQEAGGNRATYLTPFEFYFYHFANCPVRRHLLTFNTQQQPGMATNVGDYLYPRLLEDYLSYFLPLEHEQQVRLFTQPRYHSVTALPSPIQSPQPVQRATSTPRSGGKTTLFRKDFAPQGWTNESYEPSRIMAPQTYSPAKTTSTSGETWRSEVLVKIFILFWLENYARDSFMNDPSKENYSALRNSASLPSSELLRVVRLFLKHSHYFSNACKSASTYIPTTFKSDIFCGDPEGKRALFAFFVRSIDHWPLDASFRLVIETWLSYIQPWRYTQPHLANAKNDDVAMPIDSAQWSGFVNDNFKFYTTLFAKILHRFFRVDLTSNKNAYMLFRLARVYSQENLLTIIKDTSPLHCHPPSPRKQLLLSGKGEGGLRMIHQYQNLTDQNVAVNLFGQDFKEMIANLLTETSEARRAKQSEFVLNMSKSQSKKNNTGFGRVWELVSSMFGNHCSGAADTEKAEAEKTLQHLEFVVEKFSNLFQVTIVTGKGGDCVDGIASTQDVVVEGNTLSPNQRLDILLRKAKVETKYDGNPDMLPIRSDEVPFLVRLLLHVSKLISLYFQPLIDRWYYKDSSFVFEMFRQICSPPCIYRRGDSDWDANSSDADSGDGPCSLDSSFCSGLRNQKSNKARLPPRITLRNLASYRILCYIVIFFLFAMFIWNKSAFGATLYLTAFYFVYLAIKGFLHPIKPKDVDLTEKTTTLHFDSF